jgi:hypothetical protein
MGTMAVVLLVQLVIVEEFWTVLLLLVLPVHKANLTNINREQHLSV